MYEREKSFMKNYLKNLFLKVTSLVLVLFLTLPSQIFASAITSRDDKTYDGNKSIMGLAGLPMTSNDDLTETSIEKTQVLSSDRSIEETNDFFIEKSASISKTTGRISYRIAVTNKEKASDNNQSLVFAINSNLSDMKVEKVTALGDDGQEREISYKENSPSILKADKDIETFALSAANDDNTTIYYISAKLSDERSLEDIENSTDLFAIDYAIVDGEDALYQERYSLKIDDQNHDGHFALLENEDSTSNINATYEPESSNIFGHIPATISYTDFVLAKDNQEFIYKLQLDDNQATENSQINIDFYQAKEEGYVVNKTYSQNIPFTKELKLQIPSGQIAKINFTSTVKENVNPQNFTFNNKTIANPNYKNASNKEGVSKKDPLQDDSFDKDAGTNSSNDSITDDKDLDFSTNPNTEKAGRSTDSSFNKDAGANLSNNSIADDKDLDFSTNPNTKKAEPSTDSSFNKDAGANSSNDSIAHTDDQDFSRNSNTKKEDSTKAESSNNESRTNSSNDSIADEKDQDFSSNSKTEDTVSAIAINKDGYLAKLNNESRLTNDLEEAINDITSALEAYNNDEIYLDELQTSIGKIASEYNLESSQIEEIIKALISGLNDDKHKVAKLNVSDIEKAIASNDGKRNVEKALAGPDAKIPSDYLDRLVSEKLQEEGITIEDFQNYMYELEEKYGLSNEDVDRIYTDNEETIKNLISKAQEEKATGDVFIASDIFANKQFRLLTQMDVLAVPNWQIPAGWYFDVNIGPYLYPASNELKPLKDENGKIVARAKYIEAENKIRYTFPEAVKVSKNLDIDQMLAFNTSKIGNASQIDINISVKPKNMLRKSMPTMTVRADADSPVVTAFPGGKVPVTTPTEQQGLTRTYPYNMTYWTYQYYQNGKINWDIKINTAEAKLDYLNYNSLALALYAPENQGLKDYKVTIKDYKGSEFSTNQKGLTETTSSSKRDILSGNMLQNGNLFTLNREFYKSELPEQMYIHVEATPKDKAPVYQMYDLGLRLTPDTNYISDIIADFKNDFNKLLAMMPWILPYKSGDEALEKFNNGFNLIDTRLPADAQYGKSTADKYIGKSYADKSRSIFGQYVNDTDKIKWQVSETLRLQDSDRLLLDTSKLGEDIISKKSFANTNPTANPTVEVLEPTQAGTYRKIISDKEYRSASDLRRDLKSQRASGLIPGTIINYTYTSQTSNKKEDSSLTIDFLNRDETAGPSYGGKQTASISESSLETGILPGDEITDNTKFQVLYAELSGNHGPGQVIAQNGEFVYCINPNLLNPGDYYNTVKMNRILNAKADSIWQAANRGYSQYKPRTNKDQFLMDLKKVFYFVENYEGFTSGSDKYFTSQDLIYRAIDGNLGKDYGYEKVLFPRNTKYYEHRNFNVGDSERGLLTGLDAYSVNIGAVPVDGYELEQKNHFTKPELVKSLVAVNDLISKSTISDSEIDKLVQIDLYRLSETPSKKDKYQEVIAGKVLNPINFNKVDSRDTKKMLDGSEFEIYKDGVKIKTINPSGNYQIYLDEGTYTLKETKAPNGYKVLSDDVKFTITKDVRKKSYNISKRGESSGSTAEHGGTIETYDILSGRKYKISQISGSNLVIKSGDGFTIIAKNEPDQTNLDYGFKLNKKLLGADGNYHKFPYVKFILSEQGFLKTGKFEKYTNANGEIEFTGLGKNSTWILEEVVPDGIKDSIKKWEVKVDANGKVTIDGKVLSDNTIEIKNEPISYGNFKIKKVDQDGKPLGNAGFTLYKRDKSTVVKSKDSNSEEYFTDENGNLYYSNIPDGIYYLKETTPPKGYTRASTSEWTSISIKSSNINIVDGDIASDQIDQYVRFGNTDETVSVKSIDGEESSLDVDENGNVNISTLGDGQYELSQNNNKITVHIKDGKLTRSYQGGFVTDNPDQPSTNDQSLVKVSADLTQALVRYPNDYKSYAYPSEGYIDVSRWSNGTYKIEDEIAKELITVEVKDGKLANTPQRSNLYESVTTTNWKSDLDYQKDANYPDYMNMKDYVELTDYDSGELTSYILLKPDNKLATGNGTDKDTIFNIMASNANIKSVEIFDIGGDDYKAGPNASMDDQSMGSYIRKYSMQGTNETRDRKDRTYITIDGKRRGSVYTTDKNSVKISIPASRFGEDWSYLIRVKSKIYNKDYSSIITHHWVTDNDTPGEAYLGKDFDVPAYKDLTETRKVANITEDSKNLAANVIDNIKEGLLGSLVQTAYAAETSDFSKVEISHTPNGASDYIEYTVVNVIDNVDVSFTKYGICKYSNGEDYSQILPGAEFKLQILKDNEFVDTDKTATSDSNGQVSFEDLSTGEYQIIETKVSSDAYRLPDGAVKTFEVKGGKVYIKTANGYEEYQDNVNDYIYNEQKGLGKLRVHKVDESGDNLAGVEFTLYKFDPTNPENAIDIVNSATTDSDGYAVWEDLPYGKYWIKETKARPGYILDTEKKLVNITKDYTAPDLTNPRDISNSISIDRYNSYVYSTEGYLNQVFPNYGQGLVANLTLNINPQTKVIPGDQFTLRLSDNLDLDGVSNVSDGSDGKYDIIGRDGTIAKAKIENDRKTITYTFTNAIRNKSVSSMRLVAPMYPNRLLVQNDSTPQFSISIGRSNFVKNNMTVYYSHYQKDNTKPFLNAYTYKLDPQENKFTVIAYVNSNRVYSKNKQYLFEANAPVKIDSFETYRSSNNNLLPASYGIDFSNPGQYGLTYLGDRYNYNNANQYWVELEANNNYTYVIKIEGTIQSSTPTAFETQSYLTHTYDNCCWDTYTANTWSRFYDPSACGDTSTDEPEPTEQMLEFVNKENAIEFTKVDESEDPLQGAKFKLVKDGKDYGEIQTSDAQGKFGWKKLEEGRYEVIEIDAPRGYTKPQDPVSCFEVNENGEIINIKDNTTTIKNYKASLPITGGPGSFIGFALIGTAVMLTALAYFGFYQMRSIPFKRRSIYR